MFAPLALTLLSQLPPVTFTFQFGLEQNAEEGQDEQEDGAGD